MAEPNPQQLLANTLSVVAVLLMSSGILVNTLPLESRRPADSAPCASHRELAAITSGEAQLSRAPSAARPASRSICGPSAAR